MHVLIVGSHGQIGQSMVRQMAASDHRSRAMVRDADQQAQMKQLGAAETVVADLEGDVSHAVEGCDAVVFVAGSGGGTGPDKTDAIDRDGAIGMVDAARKAGVKRFVMLSSMGADAPKDGPDDLQHYLEAKQAADQHLIGSGLDYTIVRPGALNDDRGTQRIEAAKDLHRSGEIPRDDVAAVLIQVLAAPNTIGAHFEVLSGGSPLQEAVASIHA